MTRDERRLRRHLVTAVLVKLALLAVLWFMFVRGERVDVDADQAAGRLGSSASPQGVTP
jgi:hypothetical protein